MIRLVSFGELGALLDGKPVTVVEVRTDQTARKWRLDADRSALRYASQPTKRRRASKAEERAGGRAA